MADGKLDPKKFFGGPLSRHAQGIGKRPEKGYWNDVREDKLWQDDIDCAQAGQAVGAIHSIPPAAALMKSMMEELVVALQLLGKLGSQVPLNSSFKIAVPPVAPLTLSHL